MHLIYRYGLFFVLWRQWAARLCLSILFISAVIRPCEGQYNMYNFHYMGVKDGLHDGVVRGVGQDKYGYVWIATVGALNRFDGVNFKRFVHINGDSTSPYSSQPYSICSDKKGRLWIGYQSGLMEFIFSGNAFRKIAPFKDLFVQKIIAYNDSILFVGSPRGLFKYNILRDSLFRYSTSASPGHAALSKNGITDIAYRNGQLYLATGRGLVIMDPIRDTAQEIGISGLPAMPVRFINVDYKGNIWLGTHSEYKLIRLSPDLKTFKVYDQFLSATVFTQQLNLVGILAAADNRVWVATAVDGLLEYDEKSDSFMAHLKHPQLPSSPHSNNYRCIYQQPNGIIWLGGDFEGISYFDPSKRMFQTIFPFPNELGERQRSVARAFAEDKNGNYWMGTHDGVSCLDPKTGKYRIWRNSGPNGNVLRSNMTRSMYCDADNNIWVGTNSGVHLFNNRTQKMELVDQSKLPYTFYNSITADNDGNIWFCTNDSASLYWYSPAHKTFNNISHHPALKKYQGIAPASYVIEDSKQRLWISFGRKGVVMYDKRTGFTRQYLRNDDTNEPNIAGNQVVDIKEDKKGIIWISTFNGITGINVEKNQFTTFDANSGLPGNMVSPLVVDSLDRIWIGATGGLMMLNANRTQLTLFNENDGLPSVGFPEHAGQTISNGYIVLPGNNGFVRFNPYAYREEKKVLPCYLSSYSILNQSDVAIAESDNNSPIELKPGENSVTFRMVAINFQNPAQNWFAYKLEGFDKQWHYTQLRNAVYTNLPGGKYKFLYKATINNYGWNEAATQSRTVIVNSFFYTTTWFKVLMVLLAMAIISYFFWFRLNKHKQIISLESKATSLEKEKALIQYESLKQQLNPHFLFNSLTSLRSLIKTDTKMATWFLDGLSKVYRYILKSGAQEMVELKDELAFAKTFAELQKVRFGKGLEICINIDEEYNSKLIAPAILQNLVENAIKHNTTSAESPLNIEFYCIDDYVIVRNNLQRYRIVETSNKSGLASLKKLYSYYTDKEILIEDDDHYFSIHIPLL